MSMLAGPRRKQKVINLRAKNSAWSNDSNKFGQRMLEKMGWSSGKGLGAKENGIVEHVVARYKNDEKGLGFEDRNDQWTKHEDDFNALLANLSNGDSNEEKLHSGVSLEHKSKKSKARVHYHKFTRGKDLTRYSEKDLANIFGKKSLKNEAKPEVPKEDTVAVKITEQVFTEKGSMEDYFKNKLSALKTKVTYNYRENDDEADYSFQGFAGTQPEPENQETGVAVEGFSFYNNNTAVNLEEELNVKKLKKKKKDKSKKDSAEVENETENCVENNELPENVEQAKKKKSKMICNEIDNNELTNDEVKTKKKKSKTNHNEIGTNEIITDEGKTKKKKSKSSPEKETDELPNHEFVKKKNKDSSEGMDEQNEESIEDCYVPKKKKKRKNKDNEL